MADTPKAKMYILVLDDIPLGLAVVAVAHASMIAELTWGAASAHGARPQYVDWQSTSFRKVVCKVDERTFEAAKAQGEHVVVTESRLDGVEVALVFLPQNEPPKFFQYLSLYR